MNTWEVNKSTLMLIENHIIGNAPEMEWLCRHIEELPSHIQPVSPEELYECLMPCDENGDVEPREVFVWYRVDGILADKLREKGEVVLYVSMWGVHYWGRCSYGAGLCQEGALREIAMDLFPVSF